jgi:plastocyanin
MGKRGAALLLAFLVTASAAAGTVTGKITLVKDGKELPDASNVVVWVDGTRKPPTTPTPPPAKSEAGAEPAAGTMKQAAKRFQPRVVAVPKNSTVEFPNQDPIYHNVFSVSGANRFDLGLYRSGASKPKTFEEAGLVRVYCNIHPQMVGFVMVVDSDYLAVTSPSGEFELANVPAGARVLKVWHEEANAEITIPITVKAQGAQARVDAPIRIDISGYKPEPHKNKYGKDYKPPPSDEDERY